MTWTTSADLRAQVRKLWDKGRILAVLAGAESPFPLRLALKGPGSAELSKRFVDARAWIADLQRAAADGYRLVLRETRHRVLGTNAVPEQVWVDSVEDAIALIGKRHDADRFRNLVAHTAARQPCLLPWLQRRPMRALELAAEWPLLMDRATLLAHRQHWTREPDPTARELSRLKADERALYDDLRDQRLGKNIRLEQERIAFGWLNRALAGLQGGGESTHD